LKILVGSKSLLDNTPNLLDIEGNPYILTKDLHKTPILYSAICPHQHNVVKELNENIWRCPSHGWTFDPLSGCSVNAPQQSLQSFPIIIEGDSVYADLPEKNKPIFSISGEKIAPRVSVVGSAALLIEWNGFKILTDPWIEGTAVFGSWANYPPSGITVNDLQDVDMIWISHEHSDHFNEYSLSLFRKDIPVFVPDFDNNRLAKLIAKLGFTKIHSMKTDKIFSITNDISAICFKSGSVWNDNILLLRLGNFTILNVNDAGFNWRIKDIIGKIDLICIQFSPASGYPMTWDHLDNDKKLQLMKERNLGMLKMIKQITEFCQADYVLPFANFNELCYPEHAKYVAFQPKNRPSDVKEYLKNTNITVLDLLPGESWDGKTGTFSRKLDREKFYEKETKNEYLKKVYEKEKKSIPTEFNITHDDLKNYFESLSNGNITKEVGNYTVSITIKNEERQLHALISFNDGKITYSSADDPIKAEMQMICPGGIVQKIIKNDLSWDEISSGYWSRFSREPDLYNVAFWKLLHAPWRARQEYANESKSSFQFINTVSIADVIEHGGFEVSKIFEKYSLPCAGCEISIGETVEDGCRLHGFSKEKTNELLTELKNFFNKNLATNNIIKH
jgi:CMP-N-acetylneuraminate monooxygenase